MQTTDDTGLSGGNSLLVSVVENSSLESEINEGDADGDGEGLVLGDLDGLLLGDLLTDGEVDGLVLGDLLTDGDVEGLVLGEILTDGDTDGDKLGEMLTLGDIEGEMLGDSLTLGDTEGEILGDSLTLGDTDGEMDGDTLTDGDTDGLIEGERDGLMLGLVLTLGETDELGLVLLDIEGLILGDIEAEGDGKSTSKYPLNCKSLSTTLITIALWASKSAFDSIALKNPFTVPEIVWAAKGEDTATATKTSLLAVPLPAMLTVENEAPSRYGVRTLV